MAFQSIQNELLKGTVRLSIMNISQSAARRVMLGAALLLAQQNISQQLEVAKAQTASALAPEIERAQQQLAQMQNLVEARQNALNQRSNAKKNAAQSADRLGEEKEGQNERVDSDETSADDNSAPTESQDGEAPDSSAEEDAPTEKQQPSKEGQQADAAQSEVDPDAATELNAPENGSTEGSSNEVPEDEQPTEKQEPSTAARSEVDPEAPTELNQQSGQESQLPSRAGDVDIDNLEAEKTPENGNEGANETPEVNRIAQPGEGIQSSAGEPSAESMPDTVSDEGSAAGGLNEAKNAGKSALSNAGASEGAAAATGGVAAASTGLPGSRMFLWEMMGTMFEDPSTFSFFYVHGHFYGYLIKDHIDILKTLESMGLPTDKILEKPDIFQWFLFGVITVIEGFIVLVILGCLALLAMAFKAVLESDYSGILNFIPATQGLYIFHTLYNLIASAF